MNARAMLREGLRSELLDDLDIRATARRKPLEILAPGPEDIRATLADLWQTYAMIKLPEDSSLTRHGKRAHWDQHIAPYFGAVDYRELTALHIEGWRARIMEGSNLAPKTIDNITTTLRTLTKWAYERGYIDADPGARVKLLRRPSAEKRLGLQPEESMELMAWIAENLEDRQRFAVALTFYAGLRMGELFALEKSDLDPVRGVVTVRRAWTRATREDPAGVKETKGKQTRSMAIPPAFAAELFRWSLTQPGQLLICSARKQRLTHWSMADWTRKACKGAGVYVITPHGLRHSTGIYCYSKGMAQAEVARYLGHKQTSTTDIYTRVVSAVAAGRKVWE